MNRNSVAAYVRRNKEEHPDLYCKSPNCLWRGRFCPKLGHWRRNGFSSVDERRAAYEAEQQFRIDNPPFDSPKVAG